MNKYLLTLIIGICIATVSCKKEKENITPSSLDYISGTWRATHFAYDNNGNNIQDTIEKYQPLYIIDYTFYPDSRGTIYSSHPTNQTDKYLQYFDWNFRNDNKEIEMILKLEYRNKKELAKINLLDNKHMILEIRDSIYTPVKIEWIFLEKENDKF